MKTQLEQRLAQLRQEYEAGQQQLSALEARATALRETLLRISGAIQVLEEELGHTEAPAEPLDAAPAALPDRALNSTPDADA